MASTAHHQEALEHGRLQRTSACRDRIASLRAAWMAHTLKRAIRAVRAAGDGEYRLFGLERQELLAALDALYQTVNRARVGDHVPTTIAVAMSGLGGVEQGEDGQPRKMAA